MKKNSPKIILFLLLFFGLAVSMRAEGDTPKTRCQNGVCTSLSSDLADELIKIPPSQSVNLDFSVHRQAEPSQPPICNTGTQLFYAVRHGIGGSAANWDYVKAGPGEVTTYSFNSGLDQQKNRYQGIFYCWSFQGTSKAGVDAVINRLRVFNQVWFTLEFNMVSGVSLPVTGGGNPNPVSSTSKKTSLEFPNPLAAEDLTELIGTIQTWLFYLAIPIAVIMIVVSGIIMMASGGDPGKFGQAKKMLLWSVVGLAVILIGEGFLALIESIINLKNR